MATPSQVVKKTIGKTPQTEQLQSKTATGGWWQLKDRNGNLTDTWLPLGVLQPAGWYPGDPDIVPKEKKPPPPETPPKTILPHGYDATTGCTPAGANITAWRVAHPRRGVPGESEENSFNLATPTH